MTRLTDLMAQLRFDGGIVSLTTESYSLSALAPLLQNASSASYPDLVQLMMSNYYETLSQGLSDAQGVVQATGYPLSRFRLGVKPQCGVSTGELATLQAALPDLVSSGAGLMLWNLGRDYPCAPSVKGQCDTMQCAPASAAGQSPFTTSAPFAFSCAASDAWA